MYCFHGEGVSGGLAAEDLGAVEDFKTGRVVGLIQCAVGELRGVEEDGDLAFEDVLMLLRSVVELVAIAIRDGGERLRFCLHLAEEIEGFRG